MRIRFDGRVVVVTGAGRGLGRAYALLLASLGARVVVNDLGVAMDGNGPTDEAAGTVAGEIAAAGGQAIANADDVSEVSGASRLIAQAVDTFGAVDALVCNVLRLLGEGLLELYGLTEGIATTLKPEVIREKIASVGTPLVGGDIKIIDDSGRELPRGEIGEIVGYSTGLMRGYHKRPRETAEVIWKDVMGRTYLRTGDIGRLDEDGFLYILDRKKDMIISGGVNVFPRDIEDVLLTHPHVADASVIGIPHEKWGETPLAIVILKPGGAVTEREITEWVNERVAKYQRVAGVRFRSELPRNALGKVLKKELRADVR